MQVFPTVEGVEVFLNEAGSITIRQESAVGDEPAVVAVPICHIDALCRALRATAKEARDSKNA